MPIVQPDTTQQVDMGPIEPGTYPAVITDVTPQASKEKGTPMLKTQFDVTIPGSDKPRPRTSYIVIQGAGSWNFDQLLRACNMGQLADQFKDPTVSPKPTFDTDRLKGQKLQVVVEKDLYQGQVRDKITGFIKL